MQSDRKREREREREREGGGGWGRSGARLTNRHTEEAEKRVSDLKVTCARIVYYYIGQTEKGKTEKNRYRWLAR